MSHEHHTKQPQDKVCGYEYTVRRGDSFYLIANRLGVPLRDLLEANSDINPARLMVGDVLCIPMEEDDHPPVTPTPAEPTPPAQTPSTPAPTEQAPAEQVPEVLPETDDLDAPATLPEQPASPEDMTMDEAILVCPEANRHVVAQGETAADIQLRANINLQTLQSANPSVDLTSLTAGQTLCVPDTNVPCPVPATYTLLTDDTLESVALRLNASLGALLRANPCLAPGDFRAGACIFIPED